MPKVRKSQLITIVVLATIVLLQGAVPIAARYTNQAPLGSQELALAAVPAIPIPIARWQGFIQDGSQASLSRVYAAGPEAPPHVNAKAYLIADVPSQTVLSQLDADVSLHPASTVKLLTALVALEAFSPQTVLTVRPEDLVWSNVLSLQPGEQFTVEDLLKCLLIPSSNESAEVLAREYPNGYAAFVARMNSKAQELGLSESHFANPTGYDDPNQYMSANDLYTLASAAMQVPLISQIVREPLLVVTDVSNQHQHMLESTNQFLKEDLGAIGIKTGTTALAGEVLVSEFVISGHHVRIVMMGSTDRYADTQALFNWLTRNYVWIEPATIVAHLQSAGGNLGQ